MTPEVKKTWTDALRSDVYTQGKGSLCSGTQFCCLGVLLDVHNESYEQEFSRRVYDGFKGCLSNDLLYKYGLSRDKQLDLVLMNDRGESFIEIAEYIDKNL